MPYSLQVFCRRNQYEPSTTWYGAVDYLTTTPSQKAEDIALALANIAVADAVFNRWELLNADGHKVDEGPLDNIPGTASGGTFDPKLFLLVRKNVEGESEKPSVVYTPFPASSLVEDGELTVPGASAFATMSIALLALPLWNSDGFLINSYTFRHLTRRKKVRRLL